MSLNRFQFSPVTQPKQDPTTTFHLPPEDPRREFGFAHDGYEMRIPMRGDQYYVHQQSQRSMSSDQYHEETRMLDRTMDQHYAEPDDA